MLLKEVRILQPWEYWSALTSSLQETSNVLAAHSGNLNIALDPPGAELSGGSSPASAGPEPDCATAAAGMGIAGALPQVVAEAAIAAASQPGSAAKPATAASPTAHAKALTADVTDAIGPAGPTRATTAAPASHSLWMVAEPAMAATHAAEQHAEAPRTTAEIAEAGTCHNLAGSEVSSARIPEEQMPVEEQLEATLADTAMASAAQFVTAAGPAMPMTTRHVDGQAASATNYGPIDVATAADSVMAAVQDAQTVSPGKSATTLLSEGNAVPSAATIIFSDRAAAAEPFPAATQEDNPGGALPEPAAVAPIKDLHGPSASAARIEPGVATAESAMAAYQKARTQSLWEPATIDLAEPTVGHADADSPAVRPPADANTATFSPASHPPMDSMEAAVSKSSTDLGGLLAARSNTCDAAKEDGVSNDRSVTSAADPGAQAGAAIPKPSADLAGPSAAQQDASDAGNQDAVASEEPATAAAFQSTERAAVTLESSQVPADPSTESCPGKAGMMKVGPTGNAIALEALDAAVASTTRVAAAESPAASALPSLIEADQAVLDVDHTARSAVESIVPPLPACAMAHGPSSPLKNRLHAPSFNDEAYSQSCDALPAAASKELALQTTERGHAMYAKADVPPSHAASQGPALPLQGSPPASSGKPDEQPPTPSAGLSVGGVGQQLSLPSSPPPSAEPHSIPASPSDDLAPTAAGHVPRLSGLASHGEPDPASPAAGLPPTAPASEAKAANEAAPGTAAEQQAGASDAACKESTISLPRSKQVKAASAAPSTSTADATAAIDTGSCDDSQPKPDQVVADATQEELLAPVIPVPAAIVQEPTTDTCPGGSSNSAGKEEVSQPTASPSGPGQLPAGSLGVSERETASSTAQTLPLEAPTTPPSTPCAWDQEAVPSDASSRQGTAAPANKDVSLSKGEDALDDPQEPGNAGLSVPHAGHDMPESVEAGASADDAAEAALPVPGIRAPLQVPSSINSAHSMIPGGLANGPVCLSIAAPGESPCTHEAEPVLAHVSADSPQLPGAPDAGPASSSLKQAPSMSRTPATAEASAELHDAESAPEHATGEDPPQPGVSDTLPVSPSLQGPGVPPTSISSVQPAPIRPSPVGMSAHASDAGKHAIPEDAQLPGISESLAAPSSSNEGPDLSSIQAEAGTHVGGALGSAAGQDLLLPSASESPPSSPPAGRRSGSFRSRSSSPTKRLSSIEVVLTPHQFQSDISASLEWPGEIK